MNIIIIIYLFYYLEIISSSHLYLLINIINLKGELSI